MAAALVLISATAAGAQTPQQDVFAREAALTAADADGRLLIEAKFGGLAAASRLRRRLEHDGPSSTAFAAEAWRDLCEISYHFGRYRQAIADCDRAIAAAPGRKNGQDVLALVKALADVPAPVAHGTGGLVAFDGNGRVPVMLGDTPAAGVADTGAQIAVMMQSLADRAHVRFVGSQTDVETTTAAVSGRVGVIPVMTLGGVRVTDVPVLVLPDAQLTFEDGRFTMPLVISLEALVAFGRVAWLDHGRTLALGDKAPPVAGASARVLWHPLGIGLPLDGPGGRGVGHFDTGSNKTFLYRSGLSLLSAEERAATVNSERRIGGIGGVEVRKVEKLPAARLSLAGLPLVYKDLIVEDDPKTGEAARLGVDIMQRFDTVVLDFDRMRLFVRP